MTRYESLKAWSRATKAMAAGSFLTLASAPAFAQQDAGPGAIPGANVPQNYGHFSRSWEWHHGFGFHPFLTIIIVVLAIAIIKRVICGPRHGRWFRRMYAPGYGNPNGYPGGYQGGYPGDTSNRALEILRERLAKGEIGKEEFEETRKLLMQ